jgi:hypothetical protein
MTQPVEFFNGLLGPEARPIPRKRGRKSGIFPTFSTRFANPRVAT